MNFSSKLMLSDWNFRTPITDMLHLEESKFEYKKNFFMKEQKRFEKLRYEIYTRWEK